MSGGKKIGRNKYKNRKKERDFLEKDTVNKHYRN